MNKIIDQRESFERRAYQYYNRRRTENHNYYKKLMWREIFLNKDFLTGRKNMLILEPMCGYGDGYQILKRNMKRKFLYQGFDYSETLVKIAKHNHPDINISVMDVTRFHEQNQYDLILIIGGLHHVPDYCQNVIKNMYQALKKEGIFVNLEPTYNNFFSKKVRQLVYRKNETFDESTERAFAFSELNTYYEKAGFKVLDQLYLGLSAFVLYGNPNAFPMFNIGRKKMVRFLFQKDKLFFRNIIGRKLSFATGTMLIK